MAFWVLLACLMAGCSAKPEWSKELPSPIAGDMAAQDNRLVYVGTDGVAYGLDPKDAAVKWKLDKSLNAKSAPVFVGSRVCVLSDSGKVFGLDPADGKPKWSYTLPGAFGITAVTDQYLAVQASPYLALLEAKSGRPVKRISLETGPTGAQPVAQGAYLYVAVARQKSDPTDNLEEKRTLVHCFLCPSLEMMWSQEVTGFGGSLAVDDDTLVYLKYTENNRGSNTEPEAFDRKSGKALWSGIKLPEKGKATCTRPVIDSGFLYAGLDTGVAAFVTCVKANADHTDSPWTYTLPVDPNGGVICSSVAVANGVVVIGVDNHAVALKADSGKRKWSVDELDGKVTPGIAVLKDTVYLGTAHKQLYAIKL